MEKHKSMQEKAGAAVSCSRCGRIIIKSNEEKLYSREFIKRKVLSHRCLPRAEGKNDFEAELRSGDANP